jgi:hypothetical protein
VEDRRPGGDRQPGTRSCKPPTLTLLLNGGIDVSPLVPKVSDHLGIPRPGQPKRTADVIEGIAMFEGLPASDQNIVRDLMVRLGAKPKNDQ